MRARGETSTDWDRVAAITDDEADRMAMEDPDNPFKTDENGKHAVIVKRGRVLGSGTKVQKTVRFDIAVFEAFKATGKGWQTRMNEALKTYLKEHPLQPGA